MARQTTSPPRIRRTEKMSLGLRNWVEISEDVMPALNERGVAASRE
jgi:hypothetical protein